METGNLSDIQFAPLDFGLDYMVYSLSGGDLFYKTIIEEVEALEGLSWYYMKRVEMLNKLLWDIDDIKRKKI